MKKFNNEFKVNAVKIVREEGLKIANLASDLGISISGLKVWLIKNDHGGLIKTKKQTMEEGEIKRLRKENRILKQEREILKKAMGIFYSMSKANTELKERGVRCSEKRIAKIMKKNLVANNGRLR